MLPVFRDQRDAELVVKVYRNVPVLWNEKSPSGNHWKMKPKRLFDMTDSSGEFYSRESLEEGGWTLAGNVFERSGERMLPLCEGKMVHLFDHRWNSFLGVENEDVRRVHRKEKEVSHFSVIPRYWVPEVAPDGVEGKLQELGWDRGWLLGWREIARATDERTSIPAIIPRVGASHTFPVMRAEASSDAVAVLYAAQSSFIFDYVSRQKISGAHMGMMTWKQLPVPTPQQSERASRFVVPRVLELVYTAEDLAPFASDLGDEGAPFQWNERRRAVIRAELDAFFFLAYGTERGDVEYALESFGLSDEDVSSLLSAEHPIGRILGVYDRLTGAKVSFDNPPIDGENFISELTPPPGQGPRHEAR